MRISQGNAERIRSENQEEREKADIREASHHERKATITSRTKRFGDSLKHVLPHMPNESAELPMYFDMVEHLIIMYEVLNNLKSTLLLPLLSYKAEAMINRLSVDERNDFEVVKLIF